ncbi:hypothetical protein A3A39_04875 [Candidatus Kaiserbacteria bacterium RIFCSPLOWO2_01_FULL_54_13]|uniref:SHS2 domain-containing protein n=1 Tax=Candidatus Kaiserbacteria bacterium RIFCSPLOWO2_01_FULL_54_13 TaxID=1798512 RepID=A0A1F6F029_9BACT|nr:MAG: hypothetical protein A3A39_04875 [Candidatus Kaiserbacteria bacterium RIFCSPLOWO2_01_FULL_54_13]
MFRPLGKQRGRVLAVADIGSGSAGVAIVAIVGDGPARILEAERVALPFEERSPEATVAGVVAQLEDAAQKTLSRYAARKDKPSPHVSGAYAVIRPPWSHSKTIQAVSEFPQETRIEGQMISVLAEEALKGDTGLDSASVFETSVVRVQLNGYPTARPKGKRAHHIEVSLLVSDCNPSIRAGVVETLQKVFACPPPTLRSGTRALLSVLRESTLLPKECLVVNMTSQGTSMIAVRKGVVVETARVPEGSRSILKRVAGEKMPEETLTLMRLLALDQCETDACDAIKTALVGAEPELVKVFGETMGKMSAARRLPNPLILSAHDDIAPWLGRFLSRIDFAQFTMTTRPFSARALTRHDLEGLVTSDETQKADTGLFVAGALVALEAGSNTSRA